MRVLFVCTGNLCRSPFAEHLFRIEARGAGLAAESASAGTFAMGGQAVPEVGIAVAREFGVDLSDHRAAALDASRVLSADLLLGMDRVHVEELRRARDAARARGQLGLLGIYDGGTEEIADPFGLDPKAFRETYARVAACVRGLVRDLRDSRPKT